jgi:diguanylate cyclase (GGDEF)-like protein
VKGALSALLPGALVAAIAVGGFLLADDVDVAEAADRYGLVVYGAGLALSWVFHRSRVFVALLLVGLLDVAVVGVLGRAGLFPGLGVGLLGVIGLLGVVRDRGVLSRVGLAQLGGAGLLAALAWGRVANRAPADPEAVPSLTFPGLPVLEGAAWLGFPRVTLAVGVGALLMVAYGHYRWRGPVERSLAWVVVMLLTALHPAVGEAGAALFLMAAGLTLTLGIVETSYMLAYRDDLTGLPGRRALMQYLDGLQGTCTIAMVDVDHFKTFNDKHGHDVGDQVLRLVASRLARAPGSGRAYRYGGEEFTLLYPGLTMDEALPYLEATRISVEKARFTLRSWRRPRRKPSEGGKPAKSRKGRKSRTLSVTVSIGMADTAGKDSTPESVLKLADEALYRAKNAGRNQTSR